MNKKFLCFFAIFSYFIFLNSAQTVQLVMPKIIYTGDTVEIRSIFHSEESLFGGMFDNNSARLELRTDYTVFLSHGEDFFVTSASLEKLDSQYTLFLSIVPWKSGFCTLPQFNLSALVAFSQNKEFSGITPPVIVEFSPIEVKSLVQKTEKRTFLPHSPPLLLPGTTAFLVCLLIFALILIFSLIFALLHLPKIARLIQNFSYLYSLKKNARKTIKKLLALQKKSSDFSDKEYAGALQHILRVFLQNRFKKDFSSITTQKIYATFQELLGGNLSEHQENTVEALISLFNRLDYIRFAGNARFLQETADTSEKYSIVEKTIRLVEDFETEKDDDSI